MRGRLRDETGSVGLQVVLLFPVLLLAIMAVVQVALVAHADHVAEAAAEEGARAARLSGDAEAGRVRAEAFLERAGRDIVRDAVVTAHKTENRVFVEVRGRAFGLLPGAPSRVGATSAGPVERLVPAVAP